jgi:hypothetical protein
MNIPIKKETCNLSIQDKKDSNITCFDLDFLHHITDNINNQISGTMMNIIKKVNNVSEQYNNILEFFRKYNIKHEDNEDQIGSSRKTVKTQMKESDLLKFATDPEFKIYSKYFAARASDTWNSKTRLGLTSPKIKSVCKQFEEKYDDFIFLDVSPADFYNYLNGNYVSSNIMNFDYKKYAEQGKHRFAAILNTDPHNKPGEHWVCFMLDCRNVRNRGFYYYDSYAMHPSGDILEYIRRISNMMGGIRVMFNSRRHQMKYSECGMFCIHLIAKMLEHNSDFDKVTKEMPDDDDINRLRQKYFNF